MTVTIEILENGRVKETRELGDGTYTIGRDSSAGIVLDSKTVSKSHATLTIEKNTFRVADNGSANGVFCRGVKISEKTFKNAFEFELNPFTIRTAAAESETGETKTVLAASLDSLINRHIKIVFSVLIVLAMLFTLLTVYGPLKRKASDIFHQAHLNRGVLLSRYLAEINRTFLENGEHAWVRTTPVRGEDGVVYAFVVDGYGKIIAPHEKQGDFFNWDGLPQALKNARSMVGTGPGGERLIFSPVVFRNQVLGAAIIGFSDLDGMPAPGSGLGGGTIFLLLILFVLAVLISYVLTKNFLTPLRQLYEDIEIAIKEGRDHIDFSAPYAELDNLKRIVNRLLLRRAPDTSPPDAGRTVPAEPDVELPDHKMPPPLPPDEQKESPPVITEPEAAIDGPWCLVDPENYTLAGFSDTFARDLGLKACSTGMHIIEAFDGDIIVIVTQIIENPNGQAIETETGGKAYRVSGTIQNTDKPTVLIVFEEAGS